MDYDKLIEQLNAWNEQHLSVVCGGKHFACDYLCENEDCIVVRAATALSTLQAENEKLRGYINDLETQHRTKMCENGYDCVELGKLRVELEQMKKKNKYSAHDVALILSDVFGDLCACNFNGNDE